MGAGDPGREEQLLPASINPTTDGNSIAQNFMETFNMCGA